MRRHSQQPPSPFLHRVFLPSLRSTLLALAVLAIGFGSWLETNDSIDDCSVRNHLALSKVSLYRNLTSDTLSPDTVTFGLWKHCFIYALNCTCTPTRLTYEPDVPTVLEAAISNTTTIPTSHDTSYWRVIPFALATALGGIAFIVGVIVHRLENRKLQWCNAGLVFAATITLIIGFGYTYHQYTSIIQHACDQLDHHCVAIHHGTEFIVLVIGIILIGLSLFLWAYAPPQSLLQEQHQNGYDGYATSPHYHPSNNSNSNNYNNNKNQRLSSSSPSSDHRRHTHTSDVLEPWREVALFDEKLRSDASYRPIYDDYNSSSSPTTPTHMVGGPLPPPPSTSNRYRRRQSNDHVMNYSHHPSYQQQQSMEGEILQPPSKPFVSSPRRASHGSGNTFGANNMLRNSRGSSIMLEDNEYYYSSGTSSDGNHSPTHTSYRRSSSAMSPNYPTSNHPHNNNNNHRQRSQSPYSRPGTAPPTTTHPLNRKVITDQRISAYLQQQQQQ
ncbi:hypothetical protein BDA99DRAFT_608580 [Phascolomyces articulosus]|uniref:Uncharacterized protein n=1 Tax=Phascolomyces articulosus TaxID=60185 RepID=A0AAD5P9D1_9FUNG|nr:hypothetical protein BDA99DRAFT_608580 [Phascolomyces articulosus]